MVFRGKKDSFPYSGRRHGLRPTSLRIEELEARDLFSAGGLDGIFAAPDRGHGGGVTNPNPIGYTPAQIRHAYGFDNILFGAVKGDGSGQTIAIIDAFDDPSIFKDLDTFDNTFGLPGPASSVLTKATPQGRPQKNAGWAGEISLDVEWAHAMAPGAHILLVEAASNSLSNLLGAVSYAASQPGVVAVSMSWGGAEFSSEISLDSYFVSPAGRGITFVAASGDGPGEIWPSTSPNVLSVGGTSLPGLNSAGDYPAGSETGWSSSGGGTSAFESSQNYQKTVTGSSARSNPDVASLADPNTGLAVYDSVSYFGQSGWFEVGGTSAGAPLWAALVAIADQGRGSAGSLDGATQTLPALYQLGTGANASSNFHDITSGTSGSNSASPGYDKVTGLGTPVANNLVQGLVTVQGSGGALKVASVQSQVPTAAAKAPGSTTKPTMIVGSTGDTTTTSGQSSSSITNPLTTSSAFIFFNATQQSSYSYGSSQSLPPTYAYVSSATYFSPSYSAIGSNVAGSHGFGSDSRREGLGPIVLTTGTADPSDSSSQSKKDYRQNPDSTSTPDKAPGVLPALPPDSPRKDNGPPALPGKNDDGGADDGFWELGLTNDVLPTNDETFMDPVSDSAALVPGLVAFFGSSWGFRLIDPNAGKKRPQLVSQ
ncbi:MAG TPA: S53 family peptidase [Gemmataceae bacterium]|nr:S53 family peptidase [Gemmataceae bacterium]